MIKPGRASMAPRITKFPAPQRTRCDPDSVRISAAAWPAAETHACAAPSPTCSTIAGEGIAQVIGCRLATRALRSLPTRRLNEGAVVSRPRAGRTRVGVGRTKGITQVVGHVGFEGLRANAPSSGREGILEIGDQQARRSIAAAVGLRTRRGPIEGIAQIHDRSPRRRRSRGPDGRLVAAGRRRAALLLLLLERERNLLQARRQRVARRRRSVGLFDRRLLARVALTRSRRSGVGARRVGARRIGPGGSIGRKCGRAGEGRPREQNPREQSPREQSPREQSSGEPSQPRSHGASLSRPTAPGDR
jgi:hypothetical protein